MDFANVLLIAFGLAADCFAVSISGSVAMRNVTWYQIGRTALVFGIFQAMMPVFGWLAGRTIVEIIAAYDHWLAFGLLSFIGGKMLWESFRSDTDGKKPGDITRGLLLLTLAVATSIDALAVGLTFAFVRIDIVLASTTIGVVSFGMTIIGFLLGRRVGNLIGKRAELVGGIILIGIGVKILVEHLLA